jgi:Ppx/GppA phosphatase family
LSDTVRIAALGLAGAVHRLDPTGSQLFIDSGGASTEVTLTDGRRAVATASLPVGAALLGAELRGDPPEALGWALAGVRIGSARGLFIGFQRYLYEPSATPATS